MKSLTDYPTLPELLTPRLRLRALTRADAPALFTVFADPVVMRYWSSPPLTDAEAAAALVTKIQENVAAGVRWQWGLERRAAPGIIGTCSLGHFDAQNQRAELGYILGQAHWGGGLMHECLTALVTFAFAAGPAGGLDLTRLEADIDPRNAASRRTLERLGFQREGYLRERWRVAGEVCDSVIYGLLRREWAAEPQAAGGASARTS